MCARYDWPRSKAYKKQYAADYHAADHKRQQTDGFHKAQKQADRHQRKYRRNDKAGQQRVKRDILVSVRKMFMI